MFTDWPLPHVVPALTASPDTPLHKKPMQQLFLFTLTPLYTSLKDWCTPNVLPPRSLIKDVPAFMGCDTRPPQRHKGALSLPLQSFPHKQMQISSSLRLFAAQFLNYFCSLASTPTKKKKCQRCRMGAGWVQEGVFPRWLLLSAVLMHNKDMEEAFIKEYVYVFINSVSTGSNQLDAEFRLQCWVCTISQLIGIYLITAL